jgi:hypothetical protein
MAAANLIQTSVSGRTSNALAAQGDGIILPKLSTTDRLSLSLTTSDAGLMVYDTTATAVYTWSGTAWLGAVVAYTQGIWSPTFTATTGTITLNPANATGLWSRIGNTVTIVGQFLVQSVSSPTGLLSLTNLPFAPVAGFESSAAITGSGFSAGAITSIVGTITGTTIQCYHYQAGALNGLAVHMIAGSQLYISGTYITA